MSALIKAAMSEERPRVVDWGDLEVEEVLARPEPLTVKQASERLRKAAGPKQTLTVDLLDAAEEIQRRGVKKPSTRRRPVPVEDFQQLALF